jgi:aspartate carbamoyltransferase regulatory subunit
MKNLNHMNEGRLNSKSKSWNKKIKSKNTMWMQNQFISKRKKRSLQIYIPKIGVEYIENNVKFYLYLYPLGI